MTVREAMLQGIHKYIHKHKNLGNSQLTMQDLDWFALRQWPSAVNFTEGSARRTAQELVAEGVLKREFRGSYRVNKKRLVRALLGY